MHLKNFSHYVNNITCENEIHMLNASTEILIAFLHQLTPSYLRFTHVYTCNNDSTVVLHIVVNKRLISIVVNRMGTDWYRSTRRSLLLA